MADTQISIEDRAYPIGCILPFSDAGTQLTTPNGFEWLRTGTLADASAYPVAATVEHLKFKLGNTVSGWTNTLEIRQIAENGMGTVVVATYSTEILVSTDWGHTWATVTMPEPDYWAESVVWLNDRFIFASAAYGHTQFWWSHDGFAINVGYLATNTSFGDIKLVSNGAIAVVSTINNNGGNIVNGNLLSTTDGVTVNVGPPPFSGYSTAGNSCNPAVWDGEHFVWFAIAVDYTTIQAAKSLDGITITDTVIGNAPLNPFYMTAKAHVVSSGPGSWLIVHDNKKDTVYTEDGGVTWYAGKIPLEDGLVNECGSLPFALGEDVPCILEYIAPNTWKKHQVLGAGGRSLSPSGRVYMTKTKAYWTDDFNAVDLVGVRNETVHTAAVTPNANPVYYARLA